MLPPITLVHALPDGYTLLLAGMANAINVSLYPDLDFNFARDMAPVAIFARSPMVMEVDPSFPANTVAEFIAYAKAHPGTIAMGSAGSGGFDPCRRRAVSDADRNEIYARTLSRLAAGAGRLLAGRLKSCSTI